MVTSFMPSRWSGPWERRLGHRRAWVDELPWHEAMDGDDEQTRWTWTQTAYSEYAAAAGFAAICSGLAAAQAPIDLIALCGDFVVDEIVHVEAASRIANAFGGGVHLEVELQRLVKPPRHAPPAMQVAELVVRISCVGEALTLPMLDHSRQHTSSPVIAAALRKIMQDEVAHAQLGGWFLEWADTWMSDNDRLQLGDVAGRALRGFLPLLDASPGHPSRGDFANVFRQAARTRVVRPLAKYGIQIPTPDLLALGLRE